MAKMMGLMCVADSMQGLTECQSPVTRTGDYSDDVVVDGDERIIPWQRPSRIRPLSWEIRQPINVRKYPCVYSARSEYKSGLRRGG